MPNASEHEVESERVDDPDISIVIPIYNEEGILSASVADLTEKLADDPRWDWSYELILTENGSTDNTVEVARDLMRRHPELRLLHSPEPRHLRSSRRIRHLRRDRPL